MKNRQNNYGLVKYVGVVTGKEFEQINNDMAFSKDKRPVASNQIPIKAEDNNEQTALFHGFIFYEIMPDKYDSTAEEVKKNVFEL